MALDQVDLGLLDGPAALVQREQALPVLLPGPLAVLTLAI